MSSESSLAAANDLARPALTCRLCGQVHRGAPLRRGQHARCVRCGTVLARRGWFGAETALAFALTGAALAAPAAMLPFITVSKLGRVHTGLLLTGVSALWEDGMRLLAIWVAICGTIAPFLLLGSLVLFLGRAKLGRGQPAPARWRTVAHIVEHWAMPEVHVLAVLVALIKLGALVEVHIGLGFWCYVAMSVALLVAWRSYDLETTAAVRSPSAQPAAP